MKFSSEGWLLMERGDWESGPTEGEMNGGHPLMRESQGSLFVGDQGNGRIQDIGSPHH